MATWHQSHARPQPRLWHDTQWTVVVDPPNAMRHLFRTDTREAAWTYLNYLKCSDPSAFKHSFILAPNPTGGKS